MWKVSVAPLELIRSAVTLLNGAHSDKPYTIFIFVRRLKVYTLDRSERLHSLLSKSKLKTSVNRQETC